MAHESEDEEDELQCLGCSQRFEEEGELMPRMLPECGHSMCSGCISGQIKQTSDFICPDDRKCQNRSELSSYPKNFSLIRIVQRNKKKQTLLLRASAAAISSSSSSNLQEENRNQDTTQVHYLSEESEIRSMVSSASNQAFLDEKLCTDHTKRLDIVCVDCRVKVCASCALFGKHRGHQVRSEEDVSKEISIRADLLVELINQIESGLSCLIVEQHAESLKDSMAVEKEQLTKIVSMKFQEITNLLETSKAACLEEIENVYQSIETKWVERVEALSAKALESLQSWKKEQENETVSKFKQFCEYSDKHTSWVRAKETLKVLSLAKVMSLDGEQQLPLDLLPDSKTKQRDVLEQGEEMLEIIEYTNRSIQENLIKAIFETVKVVFNETSVEQLKCIVKVVKTDYDQIQLTNDATNRNIAACSSPIQPYEEKQGTPMKQLTPKNIKLNDIDSECLDIAELVKSGANSSINNNHCNDDESQSQEKKFPFDFSELSNTFKSEKGEGDGDGKGENEEDGDLLEVNLLASAGFDFMSPECKGIAFNRKKQRSEVKVMTSEFKITDVIQSNLFFQVDDIDLLKSIRLDEQESQPEE